MSLRAFVKRWKKIVCLTCFICVPPLIYLLGSIEYLIAKPYSEFSWPLEVNLTRVISDYETGHYHVAPINEQKFLLKVQPTADKCQDFKLLTVLIKSRVDGRKSRDVLRKTWVKSLTKNNYRHLFLLGSCASINSTSCEKEVRKEQSDYGDLLQGDFVDAYENNTIKMTMAFQYITEQCLPHSSVLYLLLIDDDYALNVRKLESYLIETAKKFDLYAGYVWKKSRPFRIHFHKHYMSLDQYPYSHYPPFVSAGAMLLTSDVVKKFYIVSKFSKYYPFDDVFYGFVAKKLNISPTDIGEFLPSYYNVPSVHSKSNKRLIGSHRFGKIDEVFQIYKKFYNQ